MLLRSASNSDMMVIQIKAEDAHREGRGEGERAARQQATDQAGHPRDIALVRHGVEEVIRFQCVFASLQYISQNCS